MRIEYLHASKFGNGARVAEEFRSRLAERGVTVHVQHIRDADPKHLPEADLYVFSTPGRMGRPIKGMRTFLTKLTGPAGARYALLTTEAALQPDKKTGRVPTPEEQATHQKVTSMMQEGLQAAGLTEVATERLLVSTMRGPLEDGWQDKVEAFATKVIV